MQTDNCLPTTGTPFVIGIASVKYVVLEIGMFRPFRYYGTDSKRSFPIVTVIDFFTNRAFIAKHAVGSPSGYGHFIAFQSQELVASFQDTDVENGESHRIDTQVVHLIGLFIEEVIMPSISTLHRASSLYLSKIIL